MHGIFPKALIMNFNSGKEKNPKKDENSLSWIIFESKQKLGFRKKQWWKNCCIARTRCGCDDFSFQPFSYTKATLSWNALQRLWAQINFWSRGMHRLLSWLAWCQRSCHQHSFFLHFMGFAHDVLTPCATISNSGGWGLWHLFPTCTHTYVHMHKHTQALSACHQHFFFSTSWALPMMS